MRTIKKTAAASDQKKEVSVMRNRSMFRRLGLAVAGVTAGVFIALPALAEPPSHGFNTRPPRPTIEHPTRVNAPHALHKPPPGFATPAQDHPLHKPHPVLPESPKPEVVVHVRPPHVVLTVAPTVTVPRTPHGRTVHVVQHSIKNHAKSPVVIPVSEGPRLPLHPSKLFN